MKLQVVGDFARAVLLCDTVSVNKYSSKFSFCMIYSVAFITQFLEIVYI